MMLQKLSVVLALLLLLVLPVLAQPNTKLKYVKELPKDLFTARTAVIITVVTTDAAADARQKYDEIARILKADNEKLGFNLVHYINGETLNTSAGMQAASTILNQQKAEKLFLIDYVKIAGTGSQEKYKLVITPYNKTSSLVSENQRAYSLQDETYERLINLLLETVEDYPSGFFEKGAKPNAATTPVTISGPDMQAPGTRPGLPEIYLAADDLNRGPGGTQRNFYYTVQGENTEKNAGYFGQRLRQDIRASGTAIRYLNRYRADKWAYLAGWAVITGSIVGYASEVYQDFGSNYFNDRQKVFAASAVAATITNILIIRNTNLHLKKAVDEYNMYAQSAGRTGYLHLKPSSLQLGALPVPNSRRVAPALQLTWKIAP